MLISRSSPSSHARSPAREPLGRLGRSGVMLVLRGRQPKEDPLPHVHPSRPPGATASHGGRSPEREASSTQIPEEEGVELRRTADGKGDGVIATRSLAPGETVMVGFLVGGLTGNDSHATQVGPGRWALHGGLGPMVNHSCDPNCGVRLNDGQAFDFVARRPISAGQELTFDYAMRNFTIDHFPAVCLCGAARCRGSATGWKDLPAARKADYGELVAPYLHTMDDEIRQATAPDAGVDHQAHRR
jgi:uncharacterized protein